MNEIIDFVATGNRLLHYDSYLRALIKSGKCVMSPKKYGMTLQGKKKKKVKK